MATIVDGIVIGGVGGAIAGISVYFMAYFKGKIVEKIHKKRILKWLEEHSRKDGQSNLRTTRAIASWNNLTEDRVRYICSIHKDIYLSTGENGDLWGLTKFR